MLPKKRRLSTELFEEIMRVGRMYRSPHLSLKILTTKSTELSRFAVVVPKKVAKLAVDRNHYKRQVMAVLEKNIDSVKPGIAGILFVNSLAFTKEEIISLIL